MTTTDFRPDRPARFAPAWLGDDAGGNTEVAVDLHVDFLSNGIESMTARPSDGTVRRAVVLIPSARGFTAMYTDLCVRLAQRHRWSIATTELFAGQSQMDDQARNDAISRLDDAEILGQLTSSAQALDSPRVGLIGFCVGGMYGYKASACGSFDKIVAFYGMARLATEWAAGAGHRTPADYLVRRRSEVLAIVGGADPVVPPQDVDLLHDLQVRTEVYPEAGHAFAHDPALPSYRPTDASAAWAAAARFLDG